VKIEDAQRGMRVWYVPKHAHGDPSHIDCESGFVTSTNERFIFVAFRGVACDPEDVISLDDSPYCECDNDLDEEELAAMRCKGCGKEITA